MENHKSTAAYNYLPDNEMRGDSEKIPYAPVDTSRDGSTPDQHFSNGSSVQPQPEMIPPPSSIAPNPGFPAQNPQISVGQPILAGHPEYDNQFNNQPYYQNYPQHQMNNGGHQPIAGQNVAAPNSYYPPPQHGVNIYRHRRNRAIGGFVFVISVAIMVTILVIFVWT
ncbi:unnamed protein product [Moneuplotes crassus]|uniref:Uncharacterized protein n=1 Tax=Euplotes crassus TaxID=5936 RepID=A0AAD1XTR8_EUPCR|nr:unnamed protein product [Moneuplotes crassus]